MKNAKTIVVLVCVLLSTLIASAQTPPPIYPLLAVTTVVVKADRVAEWRDVETLYSEAYKKGGGLWRRIYQTRTGNVNEFLVITQLASFADLDGQSAIVKGASETDLARWSARRNQCIESASTTYERLVPDTSINNPGASVPLLIVETTFRVKPGMGEDFVAFVKTESMPVFKKAGVGLFVLRRIEYGGSRNVYTMRRGAMKFAELEGNIIEKTLGKEGAAKYFAKSATLVADAESRIYVYQPAISYAGQ
jgi:hypothetical protein